MKTKRLSKASKKPEIKSETPTKPIKSEDSVRQTKVRVIGIGGGGGSIVAEIAPKVKKVDFVVANTDMQALKQAPHHCRRFNFGQSVTGGLGCGMDPVLGTSCAKQEKEKIAKLFRDVDLCIFIATLGGGTGSGATPVFAEIARAGSDPARTNRLILVGIFTLPFKFEGEKKIQIAKNALKKLIPGLNAASVIPNEKIYQLIDKDASLKEAFSAVNKRLVENLCGLIEAVYLPGIINIDFADLKAVLEDKGRLLYLNTAEAKGPNRAEEAVKKVLQSPLNEYNIKGADKILFNIAGPKDLKMKEVEFISKTISEFNKRAKIIFGVAQIPEDKLKITLLATGCGIEKNQKFAPQRGKVSGAGSKIPEAVPNPKEIIEKSEKKVNSPEKKDNSSKKPKTKKRKKRNPKKAKRARRVKKNSKKTIPSQKKKTRSRKIKPRARIKRTGKPKPEKKSKKIKNYLKPAGNESFQGPQSFQRQPQILARRSALDLKKEVEEMEKEILIQEQKWDTPAFLRRRTV